MIMLLARMILWFGATVLVVIAHLGLRSLLPMPYDQVNVIMALVTVLLIFRLSRGGVAWLSCFAHVFVSAFAATPLLIIVYAGTMSTVFLVWIERYMVSARSIFSIAFLAAIGVLLNRVLYAVLFGIWKAMSGGGQVFVFRTVLLWGWEIVMTTGLVLGIYGIKRLLEPKKKTAIFLSSVKHD
jgi:hypothetical protein